MRILRNSDPDFPNALAALQRKAVPHPQIEKTVREIIHAVCTEGDSALLEFTERFGGPRLAAKQLRVTAKPKADAATKTAIATAHANVRDFAMRSLRKDWKARNAQGAIVGELAVASTLVGTPAGLQATCGEGFWCLPDVNCSARDFISETVREAFFDNRQICVSGVGVGLCLVD
jgi:histidinol dehydrogenase